jgi:hypothetical protein
LGSKQSTGSTARTDDFISPFAPVDVPGSAALIAATRANLE